MVLGKRMWWRLNPEQPGAAPQVVASAPAPASPSLNGSTVNGARGGTSGHDYVPDGPHDQADTDPAAPCDRGWTKGGHGGTDDGEEGVWAKAAFGSDIAPRRIEPLRARAARSRLWASDPVGMAVAQQVIPGPDPRTARLATGHATAASVPPRAANAVPFVPADWWPAGAGSARPPQPVAVPVAPGRQPRRPMLTLDAAPGLPLGFGLQPAAPRWPWADPDPVPTAEAGAAARAVPYDNADVDDEPPEQEPALAPDGESLAVLTGESAPDLYLEHFGLRERPFSLVPDPGFLFWSRAHARAHSILEYGILTRAPITLITGEVGAGKTTLVHHLLRRLGPGVTVGLISNAHGSRGELLRWVLMALGQPVPEGADYVTLFSAFQSFLIEQYAAGRRVVLIFDEAQNLDRETLEELRMFTNVNANKDELLQLVLVGQPELRHTIGRPNMAQFAQRVAASFHLPAMDVDALRGYIAHRMKVAGASDTIFRNNALGLIHEATGGVPRLVNQLCDLALVYAYTRNHKTVSKTTVQHVLDDGVFFGAARRRADSHTPEPGGSGHDA